MKAGRSLVVEQRPPVASHLLQRGLVDVPQASFHWARRAAAAKRLPVMSWSDMVTTWMCPHAGTGREQLEPPFLPS